jgi:putative transposase
VALEAPHGLKTVHELASAYGVPLTPMAPWKPRVQKERPEIFSARRAQQEQDQEALHAQRYQQIGQRKVEWDWLKKSWTGPLRRSGSGSIRRIRSAV